MTDPNLIEAIKEIAEQASAIKWTLLFIYAVLLFMLIYKNMGGKK